MKTNGFTSRKELILFFVSSISIVMFLFYIDEGNYSFEGYREPFSWVIFLIYIIPAFIGQLLVSKLISYFYKGFEKTIVSAFFGAFLGITLIIGIFHTIK